MGSGENVQMLQNDSLAAMLRAHSHNLRLTHTMCAPAHAWKYCRSTFASQPRRHRSEASSLNFIHE